MTEDQQSLKLLRRQQLRKQRRDRIAQIETFGPAAPEWSPRLSQKIVARLYGQDSKGIHDEELVDEVGYTILARIDSILTATDAGKGNVTCPMCVEVVVRTGEQLVCPCGWKGTWYAYLKSYQGKQLSAGGMRPFFEEFRKAYPGAKGYRQKMVLIDQLIHRHHGELNENPTRAGCVNLIGGKLREVVAFLEELTYGEASTPELAEHRQLWDMIRAQREARRKAKA